MNSLTEEERAAGWQLLFDGATTDGWRGYMMDAMPEGWEVVDGALVRTAPTRDIIEDWKRRVGESKFAEWPEYGTAEEGHIGLQEHGDRVAFRNIKIRVIR